MKFSSLVTNALAVLVAFMVFKTVLGCLQGSKTTFEVGVKVGADTCKEDRQAPPENEYVFLDCLTVDGSGTIKVQFPRRQWYGIKLYGTGYDDAGPGK